jgi:hypothetical protein
MNLGKLVKRAFSLQILFWAWCPRVHKKIPQAQYLLASEQFRRFVSIIVNFCNAQEHHRYPRVPQGCTNVSILNCWLISRHFAPTRLSFRAVVARGSQMLINTSLSLVLTLFAIHSASAKSIKIKKAAGVTKFKIRLPTYLYTLTVKDADKADKLTASLPPKLARTDL